MGKLNRQYLFGSFLKLKEINHVWGSATQAIQMGPMKQANIKSHTEDQRQERLVQR